MKQLLLVLTLLFSFGGLQFVQAQSSPLSVDSDGLFDHFSNAVKMSDAKKALRYDEMLTADYLRLELLAYAQDARFAGSEVPELTALSDDLDAVDKIPFPSIDPLYDDLIMKAAADFQKLCEKDQKLQNDIQI